jgi:MFS family permease
LPARDEAIRSRLAIVFANTGHLYTHVFTILYATAVLYLPTVFDIPYGEMLGLASPGLILYGFCALPAGWIADRWSKVGMLVIFFIGLGVATTLTGLADSRGELLFGLTMLGLFASIYHPVGIAWLVANAKKQGLSLGINGVFGNLGSALAPLFTGLMIDVVSWRAAFVIPGIACVATGLALLVCWRRGYAIDAETDRAPQPAAEPGSYKRVFYILLVTMACNGLIYTGLMNTVPKLFEGGLGDALAGNYTQLGAIAGLVIGLSSFASMAGGWLADRYSAKAIYLIFSLLTLPPLLLLTSLTGTALVAIFFCALCFNLTFAAAENMLVARYTPFRWRSLAYGARFVLALGVGGLTVRFAGSLYDATGSFTLLYMIFSAAALIAASGAALLPGTLSGRTA